MNLFWTADRIEQLRKMRSIGMSYEQIANVLGSTVASARSAYTRYINGKKPDADDERQRNAARQAQISNWGKENRERINDGKRRRRAEKAAPE